MILLAASSWRLFCRRFSRLKFDLGITERLLGEAQGDVMALRKAWEIPSADVRLLTRIDGSSPGAFGEVWRADWDGVTVAVKVLRLPIMELDESTREEFDKEAEFLMRARHSNVVRFFGAGVEVNGAPFLVLELVGRGSLRSLLRGEEAQAKSKMAAALEAGKHPLTRALQLRLALDVARGMEYIHSLHALHRDLKSGNVLVTDTWRAKVADFGSMGGILGSQPPERHGAGVAAWSETASTRFADSCAASHSGSLTLTRGVGMPLYMSPEVLRGDRYGQAADVWRYVLFAQVCLSFSRGFMFQTIDFFSF
jgi:serine/threonine protein kinase